MKYDHNTCYKIYGALMYNTSVTRAYKPWEVVALYDFLCNEKGLDSLDAIAVIYSGRLEGKYLFEFYKTIDVGTKELVNNVIVTTCKPDVKHEWFINYCTEYKKIMGF